MIVRPKPCTPATQPSFADVLEASPPRVAGAGAAAGEASKDRASEEEKGVDSDADDDLIIAACNAHEARMREQPTGEEEVAAQAGGVAPLTPGTAPAQPKQPPAQSVPIMADPGGQVWVSAHFPAPPMWVRNAIYSSDGHLDVLRMLRPELAVEVLAMPGTSADTLLKTLLLRPSGWANPNQAMRQLLLEARWALSWRAGPRSNQLGGVAPLEARGYRP